MVKKIILIVASPTGWGGKDSKLFFDISAMEKRGLILL
jgi:hypothetical protein